MKWFKKIIYGLFLSVLQNDAIKSNLWSINNRRPEGTSILLYLPCDIQKEMYSIATRKTAEYLMAKFPNAYPFLSGELLLENAVKKALIDEKKGLFLEFGVFSGRTINIIAGSVEKEGIIVHGFDSFEGLPEDWNDSAKKGTFNMDGLLPIVNNNVQLHKGWFDDSLPVFLKENKGNVSFLHIDSDLYSSAKTVLSLLKKQIVPGTFILFDEYFNYPSFEQHELKAFHEFLEETGYSCDCIGYDTCGFAAAFVIK